MSTFSFYPRWKEELVCTCTHGSFALEHPMSVLTACLPTEEVWKVSSPEWARDLWPELKLELEAWCRSNNARFALDGHAQIFSV